MATNTTELKTAGKNVEKSDYDELNLDKIIRKWTKKVFDASTDEESVKFEQTGYTCDIDYRRVKFDESKPEFIDLDQGKLKSESFYETVFRNDTKTNQKFSLKTAKETTSLARFNISRAIIADGKTKLRLSHLPEKIPRSAGFDTDILLEGVGQHEVREKIQWQIDTYVDVPKNSSIQAEVAISETQYKAKYTASTHIYGNVHVNILDPANNNALVKVQDGNIITVLNTCADKNPSLQVSETEKYAVYESSGICEFRYGVKHNVILSPAKHQPAQ